MQIKNMLKIGAQLLIDSNKAFFINLNADTFGADIKPIWTAAYRHQDAVIGFCVRCIVAFETDCHA